MKKILILMAATIAAIGSRGQTNYINVCQDCNNLFHFFDFNSSWDSTSYFFYFDTTQNNNTWQVGTPGKNVFTSGFLNQRALVTDTDTVSLYPVNNISSFQFSVINCADNNTGACFSNYWGCYIDVIHWMESDHGINGGMIEVSHDNGATWVNLILDTVNSPSISSTNIYTINDTVASLGQPGFSGSFGWDFMHIHYNPSLIPSTYDTITLRFTFATNSIQTSKDGWMIGKINFGGEFEGVEEIENDNLISISPNPSSDEIQIHRNKITDNARIQIFSFTGELLFDRENFNGSSIDMRPFSNGIYFLKYSDQKNFCVKKIAVQH